MRTILGCVFAILLGATSAFAQTTTAIRVVVSGGVSPVTNDLPIAGFQCGVAPAPAVSGTTHNAVAFEYKINPADATVCRYTDPGNGPLLSLPFGPTTTYTATAAYVNSAGVGPVSNVSNPFDRPGVAPTTAPAGFRATP